MFKETELENIFRKSIQKIYSFKNKISIFTKSIKYAPFRKLIIKFYQMFIKYG